MAVDFDRAVVRDRSADGGARRPRPVRRTRHTQDRVVGRSQKRLSEPGQDMVSVGGRSAPPSVRLFHISNVFPGIRIRAATRTPRPSSSKSLRLTK